MVGATAGNSRTMNVVVTFSVATSGSLGGMKKRNVAPRAHGQLDHRSPRRELRLTVPVHCQLSVLPVNGGRRPSGRPARTAR